MDQSQVDQSEIFTHHAHTFVIEAAGWPSQDAASAAIIDLQSWTLQLDPDTTAALHDALDQEREALLQETRYDRYTAPLTAVREAQRHALRAGLQGRSADAMTPTLSLEAYQVTTALFINDAS